MPGARQTSRASIQGAFGTTPYFLGHLGDEQLDKPRHEDAVLGASLRSWVSRWPFQALFASDDKNDETIFKKWQGEKKPTGEKNQIV